MLSSGIGMATRDFDCILCQRHFSRMTADAILPGEMVCDECLAKLCQLDEKHIGRYVVEQLAGRGIQDKELEKRIISVIRKHTR